MKRTWPLIGVGVLLAANFAFASGKQPKAGPLTGTWDCVAHSSSQGDVSFTLKLDQTEGTVSGTFINSSLELPLSAVSYKKGVLEFHVDAPDGSYAATAKLVKGQLNGHWSKGEEESGEWEGKKSAKQ